MNRTALPRVRAAATRVAVITAAIVGAVYLLVAVGVCLIVTRNLTSDVDARLASSLARISGVVYRPGTSGLPDAPGSPRLGPRLVVWVVRPGGGIDGSDSSATLPESARDVTSPRTVAVGDTDVRVAGTDLQLLPGETDHVVLGQSMASVVTARNGVIIAEIIVGPILLLAVFFGALSIGRRVAAPIELSRQRQMEFTADASHELRTPLSVIEAQTSLALAERRNNDWYRAAFQRIDPESKRIRRLVEDLLWLARFDATSGQPHAEHVDVAILAHQAAGRFGAVAEARSLQFRVRVDAEPLAVLAPPEWLDRLLGVLLDNACKYAPEHGLVEVTVAGEGSRVRLAVGDSGPGIPAAEHSRIFDRFHRATDQPGGSGLGLAIADAVVRATGGRWDIGVSPAGGASMAVTWPRSLPASRQSEPVRETQAPGAGSVDSRTEGNAWI